MSETALRAEIERLRAGLKAMRQEAFEIVRDDLNVPTYVLWFVKPRVDRLLDDEDKP